MCSFNEVHAKREIVVVFDMPTIELKYENGRQTMVAEIGGQNERSPFFMNLYSDDDSGEHSEMLRLDGKHVIVTVEVLT